MWIIQQNVFSLYKLEFIYLLFVSILQKNLLEIEKKLKGLKPVSETQGKGKRILIQDIEDTEGDEERGENTEESERSNGDKSNVISFPI